MQWNWSVQFISRSFLYTRLKPTVRQSVIAVPLSAVTGRHWISTSTAFTGHHDDDLSTSVWVSREDCGAGTPTVWNEGSSEALVPLASWCKDMDAKRAGRLASTAGLVPPITHVHKKVKVKWGYITVKVTSRHQPLDHVHLLHRHVGVNNSPRIVAWYRTGRESNSQLFDQESSAMTTEPPSHHLATSTASNMYGWHVGGWLLHTEQG